LIENLNNKYDMNDYLWEDSEEFVNSENQDYYFEPIDFIIA